MLEFREKGVFCPQANIYIDPWYPVDKAIITHAHSDHARWGNKYYLAQHLSAPILKLRLGPDINLETIDFREAIYINGVKISLHPAGHIIGSAQVRLEYQGEVWVVSGDYKLEDDLVSGVFEPVRCDAFITECTFGLPIYKWKPQEEIFAEVNNWWRENKAQGKTSVLFGYALGKAQRLLKHLDPSIGKIFAHGAIWNTNEVIKDIGIDLPEIHRVNPEMKKEIFPGNMVLAPPSAFGSPWMRKFKPYSSAHASGWMALRGAKRRRAIDRGFIISDHADWPGLLNAVKETGATRIYATHGYKSVFSKYLREQGYDAHEVDTLWEGELISENGSEKDEIVEGNKE